jgi:magnesium-transporting ATPase (P-type)
MCLNGNVVSIFRNSKIVTIPESEMRNGDVLVLQAGDLVAADVKLIEARGLEVDEFDLTGEIMPVDKVVNKEDVFVYKGSKVNRGNGKGIVVATGEKTEYGKILKQRWGQVKYRFPPLIKTKYLILPVLLLPPLTLFAIYNGNIALMAPLFLGIAVFAVLMQNSGLFKYMIFLNEIKNLKRRGIQLHNEHFLEGISDVDVVCFDKTGVLTTRDIEVKRIHFANDNPDMKNFISDEGVLGLTKIACALCNDVAFFERISLADPIDKALIGFAAQNGVSLDELTARYKRIHEKPFDSEDRFMESGFEKDGKKIYFAKGDPQVILNMCDKYVLTSCEEKRIDLDFLLSFKSKSNIIDSSGDRTIALAYRSSNQQTPPTRYTFLCLVQFENPLKPRVKEVVESLQEDGVRTIIVTGDRPETALKISREIGIADKSNYSLTGRTMDRMGLPEIAKQSDYISVYSRLLPSQKGLLVRLLRQRNRFVVMVGDGANDTVALKLANVGVSFVEDSSPFAKRVSKVLIKDLPDLLTLIQSAKRIKFRIKCLTFLRILLVGLVFAFLYYQALSILAA